MRPTHIVIALRAALVAGIAASAALVVDYHSAGEPAFCGEGSGCEAVRSSALATTFQETFSISLPQFGLGWFLLLLGASLLARTLLHHRLLAGAAAMGAAGGLVFLYVQKFTIGTFCQYCVAVDVASVIAAISGILLARKFGADEERAGAEDVPIWVMRAGQPSVGFTWAVTGAAATFLPFVWSNYAALPPLPADIQSLQVEGKMTMVGFTDFQCPFCRKLHPHLKDVKKNYGDRVVYIRKMVPLAVHPGAKPAAVAYLCTPPDKQEEMADALYAADFSMLNDTGVVKIAGDLGLDTLGFVDCMAKQETVDQIEADKALYTKLGLRGLPSTYVGQHYVHGFNPDLLEKAVAKEASGNTLQLPTWGFVLATVLGGLAAVLFSARAMSRTSEEETQAAKEKPKKRRRDEEEDDEDDDDSEEDDDDEDSDSDDAEDDSEEDEEAEEDDDADSKDASADGDDADTTDEDKATAKKAGKREPTKKSAARSKGKKK